MEEKTLKKIYFVVSCFVPWCMIVIFSFFFIFESYEKTSVIERVNFSITIFILSLIYFVIAYFISDEIYK